MPETNADHMIDIDKRLNELPPIPSERCIFRVHDRLRNENKKAYEPEVVAIGPYHRDNGKLQPMEELKLRYLKKLLNRRNETGAKKYMVAMRESEQKARRFYADPISLDSNEFAEMMLLDSCFILEVLRGDEMMSDHLQIAVCRDLVLFENQLPFFVIMKLFDMTKNSTDSLHNFVHMFARYFGGITPGGLLVVPPENPTAEDIEHVLAENPREEEHLLAENRKKDICKHLLANIEHLLAKDDIKHLLGLLHYCSCYEFHSTVRNIALEEKDMSLKSTKELQEAGIKFKKIEGRNLFHIGFENGTMEIPTLRVDDGTETVFRNLIAYEQYRPDPLSNHFTAYHKLIDYLVNTSQDVDILTHEGIIFNLLGDNKTVAAMLNKLGNNIIVSYVGYEEVYKHVNEHCRRKWNFWLAILRRKYFNNPWAFISFLAAAGLLLLTVLQTIFSILSFQNSN